MSAAAVAAVAAAVLADLAAVAAAETCAGAQVVADVRTGQEYGEKGSRGRMVSVLSALQPGLAVADPPSFHPAR